MNAHLKALRKALPTLKCTLLLNLESPGKQANRSLISMKWQRWKVSRDDSTAGAACTKASTRNITASSAPCEIHNEGDLAAGFYDAPTAAIERNTTVSGGRGMRSPRSSTTLSHDCVWRGEEGTHRNTKQRFERKQLGREVWRQNTLRPTAEPYRAVSSK